MDETPALPALWRSEAFAEDLDAPPAAQRLERESVAARAGWREQAARAAKAVWRALRVPLSAPTGSAG